MFGVISDNPYYYGYAYVQPYVILLYPVECKAKVKFNEITIQCTVHLHARENNNNVYLFNLSYELI